MHLKKISELVDAFFGERHDASIADTTDPDDAVLRLHADRDLVEQIFFDAELLGDGFDHGDGEDFVALNGPLWTAPFH